MHSSLAPGQIRAHQGEWMRYSLVICASPCSVVRSSAYTASTRRAARRHARTAEGARSNEGMGRKERVAGILVEQRPFLRVSWESI